MEGQEFLVPKEGLLIRDPITKKFLPKAGAMKWTRGPLGRYWRRRIRDGSVFVGKRPIKKPVVSVSATRSRKNKENN